MGLHIQDSKMPFYLPRLLFYALCDICKRRDGCTFFILAYLGYTQSISDIILFWFLGMQSIKHLALESSFLLITQLINLLTAKELNLALPKKALKPRTFILKPGQTLLLGGLARLDYTSVSAEDLIISC